MLKLKLWQIENVVLMKVLEQDEKTKDNGTLYAVDDFVLRSCFYPELNNKSVNVRGKWFGTDNAIAVRECVSAATAEEYIAKVKAVVRGYNTRRKISNETADEDIKVYDEDVKVYIVE